MKPATTHPHPTLRRGPLAGMRIRIKLIVLHTVFSLALAGILLLALRPAIAEVVKQAEAHEAGVILSAMLAQRAGGADAAGDGASPRTMDPDIVFRSGTARQVGLDDQTAAQLLSSRKPVTIFPSTAAGGVLNGAAPSVVGVDPVTGEFLSVSVALRGARDAVVRLYVLMTIALLAVYALVAAALEIFVLPQHVYGPIRTMLEADSALQEGRQDAELIPDTAIPADELGEIMRSRNRSIQAVRRHERDLAAALKQLEEVATDLKRKNHLLEMVRRNMADADRLASLGLMSAGIAHELNTPLAVLKGLVEKLYRQVVPGAPGNTVSPIPIAPTEAALMVRVVGRLERLSESLLDFARARPATSRPTPIRPLVDEAWTLVRLDRGQGGTLDRVEFANDVPPGLHAWCDGDRIVQVLVNLLRNAVDAIAAPGAGKPALATGEARLLVGGGPAHRVAGAAGDRGDGDGDWTSITITDNGPGIDPDVLPRLFEPFASTKLDSKGTGLGLAVAEGIVREHGGVILARNRSEPAGVTGAVFEIMLPMGSESDRARDSLRPPANTAAQNRVPSLAGPGPGPLDSSSPAAL